MPYFSAFWYKHYKESPTCDVTDPLVTYLTHIEKPRKPDAAAKWTNPGKGYLVIDFIDTNWMHQKGLRSLWFDVHGYRAWTDPGGMIYRIKDLKLNELGQKYEDEIGPVRAHADGSEPKPSYLTNNEYFTGQLNNRKKLCEGGGGGGTGSSSLKPVIQDEEEEKEEEWKKYAAGIIPQFGGYDGGGGNGNGIADVSDQVFVDYVTAVPGVYTTPGAASPQSGGGSGKQKDTIDPLIPVGVKPLPTVPNKPSKQRTAPVPPLPPFKDPDTKGPDVGVKTATIDNLRTKPQSPTKQEQITSSKPSKPVEDAADWFKEKKTENKEHPGQNKTGYEAEKGKDSGTLKDFSERYKNSTIEEVQNELSSSGTFNSQLGGPILRFVEDPLHPGKYIDMRHMLVVGYKYGQLFGAAIEVGQLIKFPKSAMNPQDFYSNKLGEEFYTKFGYLVEGKNFIYFLNLFLKSRLYRSGNVNIK